MKKSLIVIDLQKGFMNNLTKTLSDKIKKYINQNKNKFDLILFTQFIKHKNSHFAKILGYDDFIGSVK